jgi:hypothetical protein
MFGEERMNSDKVDVFPSRSYHQSIFLTVDVIEVDVLVLDVIELDVLGARRKYSGRCLMGSWKKVSIG